MVSKEFNNIEVFKFITWISIGLCGYYLGNLYLKIKLHLPSFCNCCLLLTNDNVCYLEFHNKSKIQFVQDMTSFILYSSIYFYYSDIISRIDYDNSYKLFYIILYFFTILIFGIFGKIKGMQTSWSMNSMSDWPITSIIVYSIVAIIIIILFGYHFYLAYKQNILFYYILSIIAIISYYIFVYYYYVILDEQHTIHIHHWFIGHIGCLFFRFDNIISNISFIIFYGIFTQGVVNYGMTNIFHN